MSPSSSRPPLVLNSLDGEYETDYCTGSAKWDTNAAVLARCQELAAAEFTVEAARQPGFFASRTSE